MCHGDDWVPEQAARKTVEPLPLEILKSLLGKCPSNLT